MLNNIQTFYFIIEFIPVMTKLIFLSIIIPFNIVTFYFNGPL